MEIKPPSLPELSDEYRRTIHSKFPDRTSDEIDLQIEAVLQFLHIVSTDGGKFIPLTQAADEVWHELILETQDYFELCENLPGRKYVHHTSIGLEDYASSRGLHETVEQFVSWIPLRTQLFGDFVAADASNWSVLDFLQRELGMSVDDVNALGREVADA